VNDIGRVRFDFAAAAEASAACRRTRAAISTGLQERPAQVGAAERGWEGPRHDTFRERHEALMAQGFRAFELIVATEHAIERAIDAAHAEQARLDTAALLLVRVLAPEPFPLATMQRGPAPSGRPSSYSG
jgi:hypothetical protein